MNKIMHTFFPIAIIIIWLFPVSNQLNKLNDDMVRNCYILNLLILAIVFVYERRVNIKQIGLSVMILIILGIATVIFYCLYHTEAEISYGYLFNYLPFCILINIQPKKLSESQVLDTLFIGVCVLLISVGFLTVLGNTFIEHILKTYYINHYAHVYTSMFLRLKTVTFFATHSIACYLYFIIWWLLDYRNSIKKSKLNYVLIVGIIFDIIMCSSVSTVLCSGLILGCYYIRWTKKTTKKNIVRSMVLIIAGVVFIVVNLEQIQLILFSDENGLLGRFGNSGNLNETLKWATSNLIPLGLCDVEGFWLTDGGYFMHFLRGGVLLIILIYFGMYKFIKLNITDRKRRAFLFGSLLLFEVGYQFVVCMRFFMLMLFAVTYYRSLSTIENRNIRNINHKESVRK